MGLNFRLLRADEIDARVSQVTAKSVMLLLYKDARCDMNILDETVGPLNWKREHVRENANCIVSIWDGEKEQWVTKEDTGTESNTEAEKGLASDSFKRACVNWGIGRELYTAPNLFFPIDKTGAYKDQSGKARCYDRFIVEEIEYNGRSISYVRIQDVNTRATMEVGKRQAAEKTVSAPNRHKNSAEASKTASNPAPVVKDDKTTALDYRQAFLDKIKGCFEDKDTCNRVYKTIIDKLGVKSTKDMTMEQMTQAMAMVDEMAVNFQSA